MKPIVKKIIIGASAAVAASVLYASTYVVEQDEQAVITSFGKPVSAVLNQIKDTEKTAEELRAKYPGIDVKEGAGLYFKLPWQTVNTFPRSLIAWDGYPEEVNTLDKRRVWLETAAFWYVHDPVQFLQTVREVGQAQGSLDTQIDSAARVEITRNSLENEVRTTQKELMQDTEMVRAGVVAEVAPLTEGFKGREIIETSIYDAAKVACLEKYGIGVEGFSIKSLNYVDSVRVSVEQNMIAERKRVAAKYTAEGQEEFNRMKGEISKETARLTSEAYVKQQEVIAAARADAMRIYAEAYGKDPEFFDFTRKLGVYDKLGEHTRLVFSGDQSWLKELPLEAPEVPKTPNL